MKIVVVSNLYPPDVLGGYELGCRQAVEGLRAAGHDVTVLTGNPRSAKPSEPGLHRSLKLTDIYDSYLFRILPEHVKAIRSFEGYGFSSFNVHVFTQYLEENRPDIVYFWNLTGLGGVGLIAAAQQMGLPWAMHVMDMIPQMLCGLGQLRPADPAIGRAFAKGCNGRFLCCSETVLREMEWCALPVRPYSRVLPNWVTTEGTLDRNDYKPDGKLRIMSAGRYCDYKGTDLLIEAAAMLRDRGHTRFVMDLYGFGDTSMYQTKILERGLTEHVRLMGSRSQDDLDRLYPQYDVFAFPTWAREPFGFAPLEAAAHGCVPVVSRECGFSEFVRDGYHCIKVDRTCKALANAFEDAITGKVDIAKIGRTAARSVIEEFHLRALLPRIVSELEDTIRCHRPVTVRSAAQAYHTAMLTEKILLALIQTQKLDGAGINYPAAEVEYNFFDHLGRAGKANIVLGPVRRAMRKLMIPMYQRLRDLLLYLDYMVSDHHNRIGNLEVAVAQQKRLIESLTMEHISTQHLVTSRVAERKSLSRAA